MISLGTSDLPACSSRGKVTSCNRTPTLAEEEAPFQNMQKSEKAKNVVKYPDGGSKATMTVLARTNSILLDLTAEFT
jgi:hypothetical protein